MENEIVSFDVKRNEKLTHLSLNCSKSKYEADVLLSVMSFISSTVGYIGPR